MSQVLNLIGQQFGRLTVIERHGSDKVKQAVWMCLCSCGNSHIVKSVHLKNGNTKSCGCIRKDGVFRKHGLCKTSEYKAWCAIKDRCYNKNSPNSKYYADKGITVCERWLNSFLNFYSDMGVKPSPKHSLERVDVTGNYEPSNCRWATTKEQSRNTSRSVFLEYNGERKVLKDWETDLGTSYTNISNLLKKRPFVEVVEFYRNKKNNTTLADISQYLVF